MIDSNNKISNIQLTALIIGTIVGVGVLSLPRMLAKSAGADGWILIIIGGALAGLLTFIISNVMKLYPGKTLPEFGRTLLTNPVADIISVIYAIYFIGLSGFLVRIFAEVVKMFLLADTPTEVIIVTMLLTTSYIARCGVEAIARMSLIMFPITIIVIILILITLLPSLDITNLFPMFRVGFKDIIKGVPDIFFSFIGFEYLFVYMAYVNKPKKSMKYNLISIGIVTFVYLVAFFMTLATFGVEELTHQLWPLLSMMKIIEIPGAFIENIEGVVMAVWVLIVFTTLGPSLFAEASLLSKVLKHKEHNYIVLLILPIIYIVALIPENLAAIYEYMDMFTYFLGTFVSVIMPVILLIVAWIKKGNKKGATN